MPKPAKSTNARGSSETGAQFSLALRPNAEEHRDLFTLEPTSEKIQRNGATSG